MPPCRAVVLLLSCPPRLSFEALGCDTTNLITVMKLTRYWSSRRRLALVALIATAAAIPVVATAFGGLVGIARWLISTWPTVGTPERIQILSFVVNGTLTLIMVGATCLYAWLTWRMVRELEESRRLSKRPRLIVELGSIDVVPEADGRMAIQCPFRIVNVGVGPAVHSHGQIIVPHEPPRTSKDEWLLRGIGTSLSPLPPLFDVGKEASGTTRLYVNTYTIPAGRTREFASITLKFQDTEGNLFEQTTTYNVFRIDTRCSLSVAYERLAMTPYTKRWLGDTEVGRSILPDPATVVYERAGML